MIFSPCFRKAVFDENAPNSFPFFWRLSLRCFPALRRAHPSRFLQEQVDALVAQIMSCSSRIQRLSTMVKPIMSRMALNTPTNISSRPTITILFFDKLMEASLAHSDKIAELYLQEVRLLNQLAVLWGYDNYMSYALEERYGIDVDVVALTDTVVESFSKSWQPLSLAGLSGNRT